MFYNVKTVENGDILLFCTELKVQNASNTMNHTIVNIISTLHGAVRQISRSICPDLKQNKGNHVLTCLNALTAKKIIKQTPIYVCSKSIALTRNSILRNIKKSEITGPS